MKDEPNSLGAFLLLAISLGMSTTLIQFSIVASHRTTKRLICVQPNGVGGLNLNHSYPLA
jgi:hypothetical protein